MICTKRHNAGTHAAHAVAVADEGPPTSAQSDPAAGVNANNQWPQC